LRVPEDVPATGFPAFPACSLFLRTEFWLIEKELPDISAENQAKFILAKY
jgi:hypothetical protein